MKLADKRILLVDDFETIRKTIRKELVLAGAAVVGEASNGEEALKLLRESRYDAVLSDWNMPKMSGLDLLIAIRSDSKLHNTPIMLVTAETSRDMVEQAVTHKVNDFLVKPFTLQLLMERLQRLLNGDFATEQEIRALIETPMSPEVLGLAEEQIKLEKATVLVIDDNSDNLDVIVGSLKDVCQVKPANNTEIARKLLEKFPPSIILLDIMMPDEDGYDFCRWLKAQPQYKNIPVLFLTAKDRPDDIAKGLMLGAVDYVTKPVHPVVLKARVNTHIGLKQRENNLVKQNELLRRTVQQKEDSERIMQHDLRNPLQAIMLATERPPDSQEDSTNTISLVRDSVQQALDQVDQTLTLARLERGKQALNRNDITIMKFVGGFRPAMNLLADDHGIDLHWDLDHVARDIINVDITLARNLFSNLIRNAIEASKKGQTVLVSFNQETQTWSVSNPTPVPSEIRKHFFDKYISHGKSKGNGLGTYMAKMVAHAHKGRIVLKSGNSGTQIDVQIGNRE